MLTFAMVRNGSQVNRRSFVAALGLAGATSVAGCSGQSNNGSGGSTTEQDDSDETDSTEGASATYGGQLRVSVSRKPNTLNPIEHVNGAEYQVTGWLYSNLTRVDHNLELQPDLATEWEPNSDASQWTFNLRDDATFNHNGEQVTAQDVKKTIETVQDPDVGSPGKGAIGPIESVEAVDDTTARINLTGPYADVPKKMAKQFARILPADVIENRYDEIATTDFGSGPFNLETFEVGSTIETSRNEDYYLESENGDPLPFVDGVNQRVYPETTAEISAMGNNTVDVMWEVPASQHGRVQSQDGSEALRTPGGAFANLVMRSDQPPFDDNRVRKAFKYAVDKEAMLEGSQNGLGVVGQDTPISPAYQFHTDLPSREQDLDRAKELLEEAGYGDGLDLKLFAANQPAVRVTYATLLKNQLSEIGVNIEIEQVSYDRYLSEVWTSAPFYIGFYGMRFTEDGILYLLLHSEGAWNEAHWSDDEFDQVLNQARQTTDNEERAELYARAQEILHERGPYLVSFFQNELAAQRNYVDNYQLDPTGFFVPSQNVQLSEDAPTR